jgi:two-component system sensor histidine kinase/response regulator
MFHGRHYDLVLMDLRMPNVDGLTATLRIRQSAAGRHIPIIALTASAMAEDRRACDEAGMSGFLAKPIRPSQLMQALNNLLAPVEDGEIQSEKAS